MGGFPESSLGPGLPHGLAPASLARRSPPGDLCPLQSEGAAVLLAKWLLEGDAVGRLLGAPKWRRLENRDSAAGEPARWRRGAGAGPSGRLALGDMVPCLSDYGICVRDGFLGKAPGARGAGAGPQGEVPGRAAGEPVSAGPRSPGCRGASPAARALMGSIDQLILQCAGHLGGNLVNGRTKGYAVTVWSQEGAEAKGKYQPGKQDPPSCFHGETLVTTTHNLFFGGTETVSTTLRYGFLLLMKYLEIQGPKSTLSSDRAAPQTVGRRPGARALRRRRDPRGAALRRRDPHGAPARADPGHPVQGFLLPEGTNVIPLLFSIHNDPAQFKDPASFDPAHFLDPRGGFRKQDAFMAFSTGKRICLGEGLARMELFPFFTAVLQSFALTPLACPEEIDISPLMSGLGNVPGPYELRAVPR
ncbi:unnamed protein product [Eretmochelys imbricata]